MMPERHSGAENSGAGLAGAADPLASSDALLQHG